MDGAFNSQRRKRRAQINMTSLIDVMFLLLIFFMVSSTFRDHQGIDIALPESKTGTAQEQTPYTIAISAAGEIYFADKQVDTAKLRTAMANVLAEDPAASLVLRADEEADFGVVVRVIDIAREVGGNQLVIPTQPFKE